MQQLLGLQKMANRHRPLCEMDNKLITYSKNAIYAYDLDTNDMRLLTKLSCLKLKMLLSRLRIIERLLRTEVKTACPVNDNEFVFSHNGYSYCYNLNSGLLREEHKFRGGMNNPLHYTLVKDVKGFDDMVVYGEYFSNIDRKECVKIYGRNNANSEWNVKYVFERGTIRHVHGIEVDKNHNCLYILTGDTDAESGIWVAKNNFEEVYPIRIGSQEYRTVYAFTVGNELIYATDTPLLDNFIISLDRSGEEFKKIYEITGSCLTACGDENDFFFSTAVEADERVSGIKSWINYRKGPGIKSNSAEIVWYSKIRSEPKKIYIAEKDLFPCKLFQNGHFHMVYSRSRKSLFVYPIALKKVDGKLYEINLKEEFSTQ